MGTISNVKKMIKHIITPPKRIKHIQNIRMIKAHKQDITLVSCSNVIIKIDTPEVKGYFTECRLHLPIERYLYKLIDDYFDMVCLDEFASEDKKVILASVCEKDHRKKLIGSCLEKANPGTNYLKFLESNDGNFIGICTKQADEQQKKRIRAFVVSYLRPHILQYDLHEFLQYGRYQTKLTNKVLATETISILLGAEELIPHAEYAKLEIQGFPGRFLIGIFMENARGICAMDVPPEVRCQKLTGKIQRSFIRLNLLDVVCYDLDHTPNNYNVYMGADDMLEGVHAYDNNDRGSFGLKKGINCSTYKGCVSIINDNGLLNRPAIDAEMADIIVALRKKAFYFSLYRHIGLLQTAFAWKRIQQLQKTISLTKNIHPERFIEAHMFNEDTLKEELSGAYAKTYLVSFLEDCKYRC